MKSKQIAVTKAVLFTASIVLCLTANAATYTYDRLNRLTQVAYRSGKIVNYSYDPAGNLLAVTTNATSSKPPGIVIQQTRVQSGTDASFNATVGPAGQNLTVRFDYGETLSYGSTTPIQTIPSGSGATRISVSVGSFTPGRTYHSRLVVSDGASTWYSLDTQFVAGAICDYSQSEVASANPLTIDLTSVATDGKRFVAVGGNGTVAASPDGLTWTTGTSGSTAYLNSVIWDGSRFVAVGSQGTVLTSSNGATWTKLGSAGSTWLESVIWTGSQYVAIGRGGAIYTSPTGATWTSQTSGTTQTLTDIAWNGALFVAVGWSGTLLTSPDASQWTSVNLGGSGFFEAVVWNAERFVVSGPDRTHVLTSENGVAWTSRYSGTYSTGYDLLWDGGQFVMVGDGGSGGTYGAIKTSADGLAWTEKTLRAGRWLSGAAFDGARLVAVGAGGTILRSVCAIPNLDTDGDGIPDATDLDDDNDGMPDTFESAHGLNPLNASDADQDPDSDGLRNLQEYRTGTDPRDADSDDDGLLDGTDPNPTIPDITAEMIRVSVDSAGNQAGAHSDFPSVSRDGRFVAYEAGSYGWLPGDDNDASDIVVRDSLTGDVRIASVSSSGEQGLAYSNQPRISADGRYVVFFADDTTLVPGDNNRAWDIFRHDLETGETIRVSVSSNGLAGNGDSAYPAISGDGRYVVFNSRASNLVSGDSNGNADVFVRDTLLGKTERVSVASNGTQGSGGNSWFATISEDGQFVAFKSFATNLVPGDTNSGADIFMHDRETHETWAVSVGVDGFHANGSIGDRSAISGNGRFVVFASAASNLVAGDGNNAMDIFVYDSATGVTSIVSHTTDGATFGSGGSDPGISFDGRMIVYQSNGAVVYDMTTGKRSCASINLQGQCSGTVWHPTISADGRYVAFSSGATNLVVGDTNSQQDVFVYGPLMVPSP